MGKKFMGLGGTDHFWDRAKAWIFNQITSAVAAKIAEVVANAPEDLDTLKEIADWIKTHANDAAAMNTQIQTNKNNIATNSSDISALNTQIQTNKNNIATNTSDISAMNTQITENKSNIATNTSDISALKTSVAGKADKVHTHSAGDITSGTLPIANGGTGVTTQADINKAFISNLETGESDVTDGTEFVSSWASDNGFAETAEGALNKPYKRQFVKVWNYIKGKISSDLGLTKDNYGGTAATILDYVRGTPIKVRWGGPGIDSAEWYPAFNADGSALEPINKANIRAGKSDRTTGIEYTGESDGCISAKQTAESFNNSSEDWASYIICNHGNGETYYHQMLRLSFFSDTIQLQRRVNGELKGWKNVAIIENENTWSGRQNFNTAKASSKMVIPIGAPSSLEDGCIWIER